MCIAALVLAALLVLPAAAHPRSYGQAEVGPAAHAAGFGHIAGRAAAAARPTVLVGRRVLRHAPAALGGSRLGGNPDLPAGSRWPRCGRRHQTFLGQFRLLDLPPEAAELGRHAGLLLVFTEVRFTSRFATRHGLWGGRCTTLVHAPEGSALLRGRPPRGAVVMRLRPATLRLSARPDVPDVAMDYRSLAAPLADIPLIGSEVDRWWDLRWSLRRRAGRLEHRLLGYLDTPNGGNGCWRRTERPLLPWRHLLTIGLDFGIGFEVADGGRLQVEIAPADLAAGRFDRACGIFDSA
jgi:Domain of unknown function (DUF1963)